MIIRLPIDIKSYHFNIKNDNQKGHTATVSTPLKQGKSIRKELSEIVKIPENINVNSRENLIDMILSKSHTKAKINNIFVFDKISVNGVIIEDIPSFCIYVREETAPTNVHYGRQKMHYPLSLAYDDSDISINNRIVMKNVSNYLHNYAFIVEAFEYSTETAVLNLDITVIGENEIPYSKVFINRRGTGNKFTSVFSDRINSYDTEIIALRECLGYENVRPDNFNEVMEENLEIAKLKAKEYLESIQAENIRDLKSDYPYAIYDFQYEVNGRKKYLIVKYTSTNLKYFSLPLNQIQFCNDFFESTFLLLITNINNKPEVHIYTSEDMTEMTKSINSITYHDRS